MEMFEPPSFLPEIWQNVSHQQVRVVFVSSCEDVASCAALRFIALSIMSLNPFFELTINRPPKEQNPLQLEEMFSRHLCETKYINWRTVLLSCILPVPLPTQAQLINTAKQYRSIDKENTGKIDMAGYAQVGLSEIVVIL